MGWVTARTSVSGYGRKDAPQLLLRGPGVHEVDEGLDGTGDGQAAGLPAIEDGQALEVLAKTIEEGFGIGGPSLVIR
jgi:hypothetical protein